MALFSLFSKQRILAEIVHQQHAQSCRQTVHEEIAFHFNTIVIKWTIASDFSATVCLSYEHYKKWLGYVGMPQNLRMPKYV